MDNKLVFDNRAKLFNKIDWVTDQNLIKKITKIILKNKPKNLLDLGIGTGEIEKYLPKNIKINGVDISPKIINICKKNLPEAKLIISDIRQSSFFKNMQFDILFSRATLGHFSILSLLNNVKKLLSDNGSLILCESISYTVFDVGNQLKFHNLIHKGHREFPTKSQFINIVNKAGYKTKQYQVVYTYCKLSSLLNSLITKNKKNTKITNFIENIRTSYFNRYWKIKKTSNDLIYRRPWLLLEAKKYE